MLIYYADTVEDIFDPAEVLANETYVNATEQSPKPTNERINDDVNPLIIYLFKSTFHMSLQKDARTANNAKVDTELHEPLCRDMLKYYSASDAINTSTSIEVD
jgi:hypothetical protein